MNWISSMIVPIFIAGILLYAWIKKVDVFTEFVSGAGEGITTTIKILPSLVALMTAIGMFKACGALEGLAVVLRPVFDFLKIPPETIPLCLLRPVSGSGALVIFQDLIAQYGPDSYIGKVASVMQGSTETTFYTIAVYYGAIQVNRTRHTLPASLAGDLIGFVISAFSVRMLLN